MSLSGSRSSVLPGGNHEVEYLAAVVDDQVQLETVEPAHGGPALLRKAGESAVGVHALDVAL